MIEISVNLATHNRASFLEPCLVSLCEQSLSPDRYEICVINNACTDHTAEIVNSVAARYPHHHLFMVEEPIAGLSRARNCGIAATQAPLMANIDDDATAVPHWLESFLTRFEQLPTDVAGIGGEIDPVWQAPPPPWLEPWMKGTLSAASNMGTIPRYIGQHEGLFEGNSCYRRSALASIGNYPLELGRVGGLLLSGEGAINALLRFKGWRLFFEPAALIHHTIHADRLTPLWFRKRLFWQGVSDFVMHTYYQRHGLQTIDSLNLDLPLTKEAWYFLDNDTPENMKDSRRYFENLGFILAMTGIISLDSA